MWTSFNLLDKNGLRCSPMRLLLKSGLLVSSVDTLGLPDVGPVDKLEVN